MHISSHDALHLLIIKPGLTSEACDSSFVRQVRSRCVILFVPLTVLRVRFFPILLHRYKRTLINTQVKQFSSGLVAQWLVSRFNFFSIQSQRLHIPRCSLDFSSEARAREGKWEVGGVVETPPPPPPHTSLYTLTRHMPFASGRGLYLPCVEVLWGEVDITKFLWYRWSVQAVQSHAHACTRARLSKWSIARRFELQLPACPLSHFHGGWYGYTK